MSSFPQSNHPELDARETSGLPKKSQARLPASHLGMSARNCNAMLTCWEREGRQRIFTARAASKATVVNEMSDWIIVITLAHCDSTGVSVGENAVLVLKARKR
jgi:hypothetical protein